MKPEERAQIEKAFSSLGFARQALQELYLSDNICLQEVAYTLLEQTVPIQRSLGRLRVKD